MASGAPEVADVFRRYGVAYRQQHGASLSTVQLRAMSAIELCRTAALGGHVEQCNDCGARSVSTILRQPVLEFKLGFLRVEMAG
jgi:hypothetical protein